MHSGGSEDIWMCSELSESLEVNPELSIVQREVSVEVKNKARALEVTGLFPGVWNRGSRFNGVKMRSSRQLKENQCQYSNMSISYKIRSLIYGVSSHSINWGYQKCNRCKDRGKQGVSEKHSK